MVKRPKKVKTPRVKGGGKAGRDKVTGLFMEVDGTRFATDTTYDLLNSDQASALKRFFGNNYQADDGRFAGGSYQGEYEFGKNAIINTNKSVYSSQGIESLQRIAYIGNFKYGKNGSLLEGNISEVATWTQAKSLATGQTDYEYGTVDLAQVTIRGNIWNGNFPNPDATLRFYYDSQAADNGIPSNNKEEFFQYQSSKYFETNWWNTPFASNLI